VYNNIIEAEKSQRRSLTNADTARINDRLMHAFYYGLPSDIGILVGKQNNLSSTKMYKMIEKANQELEMRYESQ